MKNILMAGVLSLAALISSPSFATPVIQDLTAVVDASVVAPLTGNGIADANFYPVVTHTGSDFALNDGDTIRIHVTTINGGITMTDAGPGLNQFMGFSNFNTNSGYVPPG